VWRRGCFLGVKKKETPNDCYVVGGGCDLMVKKDRVFLCIGGCCYIISSGPGKEKGETVGVPSLGGEREGGGGEGLCWLGIFKKTRV